MTTERVTSSWRRWIGVEMGIRQRDRIARRLAAHHRVTLCDARAVLSRVRWREDLASACFVLAEATGRRPGDIIDQLLSN